MILKRVLGEPFRRNTAPCLAYGTFRILKENPDAVIAVTPADHLIVKEDKFCEVIKSCYDFAEGNDALVTLGIKPDRPETGYGYIQADQKKPVKGYDNLLKVKTFTEKPDLDLAKIFLESGDFYWNSGIFIWNIKLFLKPLRNIYLILIQYLMKAELFLGQSRRKVLSARHMLSAGASQLIMELWKRLIMYMLCVQTLDGRTLEHGAHFMSIQKLIIREIHL